MFLPAMFTCAVPQIALLLEVVPDGLKPPWNHPQLIPFPLIKSPRFFPVIDIFVPTEQSS
jgi:hypothetical protein